MTTQPAPTPLIGDAAADALPRSWQRLLALSGAAFAPTVGTLGFPHYLETSAECGTRKELLATYGRCPKANRPPRRGATRPLAQRERQTPG
jgi:hypothetical protein